MTYGYEDATAVIGPLSPTAAPGAFDLCAKHVQSVTVPRGWQMVRLQTDFEPAPPSTDDLMALADAIREVFDLRPLGMIEDLDLLRPIYRETAAYGHFGRDQFPWEATNRVEQLKAALA